MHSFWVVALDHFYCTLTDYMYIFVKNAKEALQETIVRSEEEVQRRAHELLALIDSVSKYKEFTVSKISQMKDIV